MSNFSGLAEYVMNQLGNPSGLLTGQVIDYFRLNIGSLNGLIQSNYVPTGEFTEPPLDYVASGFYSQMYMCNYYSKQVLANLGAAAYDWSEVREGDSVVRRVSKNEQAKTFRGLATDCQASLRDAAMQYRVSRCLPKSWEGYHCDLIRYSRINVPNT